MSSYRGQESQSRHEKKQRESSTSRKTTRDESISGRPITTQEKSSKSTKRHVVIADEVKKAGKKVDVKVKKHEPEETRRRNENKLDPIYLKALLEKKLLKKSEEEKREKKKRHPFESDTKKEKPKIRKDGTRTRTLSPTEVKQLIQPRVEIGAGDAGRKPERAEVQDEHENYEDDFEDYESDFEEESTKSTVDESKVQKNAPEMEQWKKDAQRREIQAAKESIARENYAIAQRKRSMVEYNRENTWDNFGENKLVSSKEQKTKKQTRRGEQLLNMISLDVISYTILEIPPIPYEDFMKAFGKTNTKQVYVQTNEDDLEEETQTEDVKLVNKWTQNPPEYLGSKQSLSYILTKEERLGVGGDAPTEQEGTIQAGTNSLWRFLSWASQMVLIILERKSGNFLSLENMPNHSKAMSFGDGFVNLNVGDVPFLKGKSVTYLCVLGKNLGRLLSVHVNKEKSFQKTMVCLWRLRELSKPLRILIASNRVTSCCFGPNQGNLVFAGLSDGSVCLWDLREPTAIHARLIGNQEWSLQSPTYTTAGIAVRDGGQCSPIVAVRVLNKADDFSAFDDFTPVQICSLDKDGEITIWTVVQLERAPKNGPSEDLGLAHWGRVKLIKSSLFSVFSSLREEIPGLYITCNDILINEGEGDGLYVANSMGSVHHCSSHGYALTPKFYVPSKQHEVVEATCLELCPFSDNYFLVGCGDGSIRLHSRHQEKPLICLNSIGLEDDKVPAVLSLSWMKMRPCVFFALDSMSRINVWDLRMSDMYPETSLLLSERRILCMKLIPVTDPGQVPFLVIGTEGGSVEIHRLKKDFGCRSDKDVQNETKMFLKYVSIL